MKLLTDHHRALLWEAHGLIEACSSSVLSSIGATQESLSVSYPPATSAESDLTLEEKEALRTLALSSVQESALKKIVADACACPVFHLLCLIDGVRDPAEFPVQDEWNGFELTSKEEDREFLHDAFYDEWHHWMEHKAVRIAAPQQKLD